MRAIQGYSRREIPAGQNIKRSITRQEHPSVVSLNPHLRQDDAPTPAKPPPRSSQPPPPPPAVLTMFFSQRPRNCWNFCAMSRLALPLAARTLPSISGERVRAFKSFSALVASARIRVVSASRICRRGHRSGHGGQVIGQVRLGNSKGTGP